MCSADQDPAASLIPNYDGFDGGVDYDPVYADISDPEGVDYAEHNFDHSDPNADALLAPLRGRGRPVKALSKYEGDVKRFKRNQRRRENDRTKAQQGLQGCLPVGHPPSDAIPASKHVKNAAYKRDQAEAQGVATELDSMAQRFCKNGESFQGLLTRTSSFGGRTGPKQFLPTLSAQAASMQNVAKLFGPQMEHKKALAGKIFSTPGYAADI